jgi:ABC-2 type transport system permease protein
MKAVIQVRTIVGKEWTEMRGHKFLVAMVVFLPLLLVGTSIALLFYAKSLPVDPDLAKVLAKPMFVGMTPQEGMQAAIISTILLVFLIMPLYLPLMIATYSIIGEKLTHTLEPLLAAPVSTRRLLLGKGLAAAAPGIAVTWAGYGLFLVAARFATLSPRVWAVFFHPMWLVAMALLVPSLTVLAVNVGIIVSSRLNDVRVAEQLGGMIVIPVVGLMGSVLLGLVDLTTTTFLIASLIAAAAALWALRLGTALFQRETILTRWR